MAGEGWFIGGDDSGHTFLVPIEKSEDWFQWNERLASGDQDEWEAPEYARRIDGVSSIIILDCKDRF